MPQGSVPSADRPARAPKRASRREKRETPRADLDARFSSHELSARVLDSIEAERHRLYREIHDGPAQVLTNAIFEIEFFERIVDRAPPDVRAQLRAELANLHSQLRESLESIRGTIFDLRPPALEQLGLVEAMRAYAADFQNRFGLAVETDFRAGPTGLTDEQELAVYRVLQEALQNVHKHSGARAVRVAWGRSSGRWVLEVTDDGVGFDAARESSKPRSFGLLVMSERAQVLGGTFVIRSAPGEGTAISLSVPAAP